MTDWPHNEDLSPNLTNIDEVIAECRSCIGELRESGGVTFNHDVKEN